jgi:hypothetical protein
LCCNAVEGLIGVDGGVTIQTDLDYNSACIYI